MDKDSTFAFYQFWSMRSMNALQTMDPKTTAFHAKERYPLQSKTMNAAAQHVNRCWWVCRSFVWKVVHDLCSSGLFCLPNISYDRFGRRSLLVSKGLNNLMPRMAMWWFLLRACNIAAPPSLNLLGEIGLLSSLVSWSWCLMFVLILLFFFSAAENNVNTIFNNFLNTYLRLVYSSFPLKNSPS